ncbi:MAG: hypothetical protein V4648_09050 [Bacteroidota bacterium]
MENKKDIGKAISDKLSSLDKTPREQVWSGISYELQKKKKRRAGFFFFWIKTLGILLIGAMVVFFVYNQNSGFNRNPSDDAKDAIIINSANGETITVIPNTENNGKNNEAQSDDKASGNNDTSIDGHDIPNNNNGISEKDEVGNSNGIKTKIGNKNGVSLRNSVNAKNNSNLRKNTKGENLISSQNDNASGTGSKKSYSKRGSSNSKKSKSPLLAKNKVDALSGKLSDNQKEKCKENASNGNAALDANKSTLPVSDLSSLQDKSTNDKIVESSTRKKDSVAAKKEKEKEININMYPKDSLKEETEKKYHKFYADVFLSPTLYGYFANSSTLDRRLDSLPKKTEIKYGHGFGLTYDLTDRVSVRIGYQKINLIYITKNAPVNTNNYRGIAYGPNLSNETLYMISNYSERMDITQRISYTEIPIEIKYLILNKNLGIKSSFGFSYLMLNENKINIKTSNGFDMAIGKTKDLTSTSVSVNLGFELDYPIFKNTKLFIEPMLNYQIMAFSDGNYKPYVFGIHTGIRYSFNNK